LLHHPINSFTMANWKLEKAHIVHWNGLDQESPSLLLRGI